MTANKPSPKDQQETLEEWHYHYPIGIFEARKAVKDLNRFEWLVKYYYRFAGDMMNDSRKIPLERLIPNFDPKREHDQIQTEINKLIPSIINRFRRINAPQIYQFSEHGQEQKVDTLVDFFRNPGFARQARYEVLCQNIERATGYYERIQRSWWRRLLNPIYWLAWLFNLPITVLAMAGVNVESERTRGFHFWLLRALMAILLTLLIIRLGISVDLVNWVGH